MTHEEKTVFFNENYIIFEEELEKRRRKWTLKGIPSLDFDDIKQIVLRHLFIKLDLYDGEKSPISHWCNTIISNQISNILRNMFYSHSRPCLKCACNLPDNGCELYGEQTNKCPLYSIWEKSKKSANDIKLPVPMVGNHEVEVYDIPNTHSDLSPQIEEMHLKMQKHLKPFEFKIYRCLFILGLSEVETAKTLGYSSKEKFKYPGYASISKAKKIILKKAHKIIENGEIDVI